MERRTYLTVLASGMVGSVGCLDSSPDDRDVRSVISNQGESATITFDDESYRDVFEYQEDRNDESITSTPTRDGNILQVDIPEGAHRGMQMHFWMDDHFGSEPEEASATYWVYVPESFEFADSHSGGGKLPGFQGTYDECGAGDLGPCDGSDGWSARIGFERPEAVYLDTDFGLSFYVYHGNMPGEYGNHLLWDRGLEFDEWHRIDQYVRMNTPGETDGILRGWIDEEPAFDRNGFFFREEGADGIRIQEFINTVYFGGVWSSPVDNTIYFDDLEIRTGDFEPTAE